jgi:DNA-directed RNA polymerase sigma subunit (sigma70/sigma32)
MEEQDARQLIERVEALGQEGESVVGRRLPDDREMVMLRERLLDGKTLKAIGEAHGIGNERVRQILNHYFGVSGTPPRHVSPEEARRRREEHA